MTRPSKLHVVQTPPLAVDRTTAAAALSVSESTLDGLVRSGELPPPRRLSANRVGWLWRELQAWVESRPVSDLPPGPGRPASQDAETTA